MKYGEISKGQRKLYVVGDDGRQKEYSLPRNLHINVQEGERVRSGDAFTDGPRNPHDILHVLGEKELQKYLVNEVQEVYRLQGVNINDEHLEVISRQMMPAIFINGARTEGINSADQLRGLIAQAAESAQSTGHICN